MTRTARIVWLLIGIGIALRAWQFAGGASLFLDEVALARNVADRGYARLLMPLDYGQVAPPAFLWSERLLWAAFQTDWSLRIIPFVGSVASIFLMLALTRRILDGIAIPLAVGYFALGVPFIMYSAQAKQYSTDVAVAIGILLLAANLLYDAGGGWLRHALTGVAGFVATWFSTSAILVVAGAGAALCLLAASGRLADRRRVVFFVLLPWAIGAVTAGLSATRGVSPETLAYMKEFWRDGFAPLPPRSVHDALWAWRALTSVFDNQQGLGYRFAFPYAALALAGFVVLWRTRRAMALLLLGPVVATAGAAVAHQYPFAGRLVLFLNPAMLIAVAAATAKLAEWSESRVRFAGAIPLLLVALPALEPTVRQHPVYRIQETRPLLAWLAAHRQPGDLTFVWYRAVPNVAWYGPRYGLTVDEIIAGSCWRAEPRRFLKDTDPLRGHPRVWFVTAGGGAELNLLIEYANLIGTRREQLQIAPTVRGYFPMEARLYDFSDSTRLARTSADVFPVALPPMGKEAIMACTAGPVAIRSAAARR